MEEKKAEKLVEIGKEIEKTIISNASTSNNEKKIIDLSVSSSRGESEPQAFKKSIAEMEEEQKQPSITMKELKALKRSRYNEIADKYQYAYVLKNKKTGLIVEIKAVSSIHACNIIGWRPKNTQLIEIIDTKKQENTVVTKNKIDDVKIVEAKKEKVE